MSTDPIEYQQPTTFSAPTKTAIFWMEPLPWRLWLTLPFLILFVLSLPLLGRYGEIFNPANYYVSWFFALIALFPATLLAFGFAVIVRLGIRKHFIRKHGVTPTFNNRLESRRCWTSFIIAEAFAISIGAAMPLWAGLLVRHSAMDELRQQIQNGHPPVFPVSITPFKITGGEVYEGVVVLYTTSGGGGLPASGDGFMYVPDGVEFPGYNRGSDGWLGGRWYWFATD